MAIFQKLGFSLATTFPIVVISPHEHTFVACQRVGQCGWNIKDIHGLILGIIGGRGGEGPYFLGLIFYFSGSFFHFQLSNVIVVCITHCAVFCPECLIFCQKMHPKPYNVTQKCQDYSAKAEGVEIRSCQNNRKVKLDS